MKHGVFTKFLNPSKLGKISTTMMRWFKGLAADFYASGMQKLAPVLNKCLDNAGDYVENKVMCDNSFTV